MVSTGPPPGGTKHDILRLLATRERSAQALAEALDVSAAAVRQHLETLEALGLVARRKVVTQPGRPTFLYRLSPQGTRVFPKRYDLLLALVVETVAERHGDAAVADVIAAAARRLADRVRPRFERADARQRWRLLLDWLESELAWQATVSEEREERRITIHQCPFHDVAREHPAVCRVFFTTLVRALYGNAAAAMAPATPPACCAVVVGPMRGGRAGR